jgi:hypothetical protein
MKPSKKFLDIIQAEMTKRAETDDEFRVHFQKDGKNIDDCVEYIYDEVKKTGENALPDEEVYAMAMDYYRKEEEPKPEPLTPASLSPKKTQATSLSLFE